LLREQMILMDRFMSASILVEQLALADVLLAGREQMLDPQDLPGRYGRVIRAIDCVLAAIGCEAVVGGGWAVWRHGFVSRVTQDVDIVLPSDRIDEFMQAASVSGFQILSHVPDRWPKVQHTETGLQVDILPEGQHPGLPPNLAPTTIPSPAKLGAKGSRLCYMDLPYLIELKIAAGRLKDKADVVELIRANPAHTDSIRAHLSGVHAQYVAQFNALAEEARRNDSQR
jgi:hypothetical protein